MLKLTRLRIDQYRGAKASLELHFHDGFNVLLGQNGSGKTTLLDLISRVVRSDFSGMEREAFGLEYDLRLSEERTILVRFHNRLDGTGIAVRESGQPTIDIVFREKAGAPIQLHHDGARWTIGEKEIATRHPVDPFDRFFLPLLIFERAIWRSAQENLAGEAVRFDESLDLFRALMGNPHFPGEVSIWENDIQVSYLPRPAQIEEKFWGLRKSQWPELVYEHADLDFLGKLVRIMGFTSAQAKIEALKRKLNKDLVEVTLGNMGFRFIKDDGDLISHDALSYGQKRMLTFFYYLAANPDMVIADELVNGLHHQWITACVEAIGERQAFLTSQNPLLLDYLPFDSADQVQASFILCRTEKHEGRSCMVWENMRPEDATEFFSAYQVGVEHVSEILQSRGLW